MGANVQIESAFLTLPPPPLIVPQQKFFNFEANYLMESITIHPRSKEQRKVFEQMAEALQIPFDIIEESSFSTEKIIREGKKKPSDFFGILTPEEGKKFDTHIKEMRSEWERNI